MRLLFLRAVVPMSEKNDTEDLSAEVVHKEEADAEVDAHLEETDVVAKEADDTVAADETTDDPVEQDVKMKAEGKDADDDMATEETEAPRR